VRYRLRGESSAGQIPRALPARNKAGPDAERGNRREGDQTLRAERGGQAKPASGGSRRPACAVGSRSPREESAGSAADVGFAGQHSRRGETRGEDVTDLQK